MPDLRFAPPPSIRIPDTSTGLNQVGVRSYNERLIMSLLLQKESLSRLELCQRTNLSAQTISMIVRALERDSFVSHGKAQPGRVGPPTTPISLNPNRAFSIGVDVAPNKVTAVIIDFVGQVKAHSCEVINDHSLSDSLSTAKLLVKNLLNDMPGVIASNISGIGIGLADQDSGHLVSSAPYYWNGQDIESRVCEIFDAPIFLQNRITATVSGESLFGIAKELDDFLYFYVDDENHSRLVLNHRINSGLHKAISWNAASQGIAARNDLNFLQWEESCVQDLARSIKTLQEFVNLNSVLISGSLSTSNLTSICENLQHLVQDTTVKASATGKLSAAIGAASLPLSTYFIAQP